MGGILVVSYRAPLRRLLQSAGAAFEVVGVHLGPARPGREEPGQARWGEPAVPGSGGGGSRLCGPGDSLRDGESGRQLHLELSSFAGGPWPDYLVGGAGLLRVWRGPAGPA
eukprot:6836205-Pyramimonas_sp.AAC.1